MGYANLAGSLIEQFRRLRRHVHGDVLDEPLLEGLDPHLEPGLDELLEVDLTSHQVVATTKFVPDGQLGGGVWTSPTYDAASNIVFVARNSAGQL